MLFSAAGHTGKPKYIRHRLHQDNPPTTASSQLVFPDIQPYEHKRHERCFFPDGSSAFRWLLCSITPAHSAHYRHSPEAVPADVFFGVIAHHP